MFRVFYIIIKRSTMEYAPVVWNIHTSTDIRRIFADLRNFSQLDTLRNYGLIFNCLNFRTLYSGQHLDDLLVWQNKLPDHYGCCQ
jgi:hypothetical protein